MSYSTMVAAALASETMRLQRTAQHRDYLAFGNAA